MKSMSRSQQIVIAGAVIATIAGSVIGWHVHGAVGASVPWVVVGLAMVCLAPLFDILE